MFNSFFGNDFFELTLQVHRGRCVCSKTRFCFVKPLAPPAKDSLRSSFASGGLSRLWRSILALCARGLLLTDRVKPSLWQRLSQHTPCIFSVTRQRGNLSDNYLSPSCGYSVVTLTASIPDMPTSGSTNLYFEAHKPVFFNKKVYFLKTYTNRLPLPHFISRKLQDRLITVLSLRITAVFRSCNVLCYVVSSTCSNAEISGTQRTPCMVFSLPWRLYEVPAARILLLESLFSFIFGCHHTYKLYKISW